MAWWAKVCKPDDPELTPRAHVKGKERRKQTLKRPVPTAALCAPLPTRHRHTQNIIPTQKFKSSAEAWFHFCI